MFAIIICLVSALVLIGADQWIKYIVDTQMQVGDTIPLWNGVLHITYLQNLGAAFGSMQGQKWLLIGVTSVVLLGLLIYLCSGRVKSPLLATSLTLIVAGGIGNLIDRIFRGFVVDYVDVRIINFAIFNLADCCVVIGTALLLLHVIRTELRDRATKKAAQAETEAPPPDLSGGEE